jgi:hypothetical protein
MALTSGADVTVNPGGGGSTPTGTDDSGGGCFIRVLR